MEVLDNFLNQQPPNDQLTHHDLANRLRCLFDHLDGLVEKLSLRTSNRLCDALAQPYTLATLLSLLSDISATSSPIMQDVRRTYRYPYITTTILANGTMNIREAFIASNHLVSRLLSFLDGEVLLLESLEQQKRNVSSANVELAAPQVASQNPILVGNVVQILISYLGTNPEVFLQHMQDRSQFIPAIVGMLHIGSIPQLFAALIPDRCVDDILLMDHSKASFDAPMTKAIAALAAAQTFHLLANAFISATQTIYSAVAETEPSEGIIPTASEVFNAEQLAFNITQVYSDLVQKTIRAVRINASMPACSYLHVFGNPSTASTIALILNSGIELFRETKGSKTCILENALSLTTRLLEFVEDDAERRVASVAGQPPSLNTSALEAELQPILMTLLSVLIDIVNRKDGQSKLRRGILELFVTCMRVCSESLMRFIDKQRFGEVALKIMMLHSRNSLIHHIICRAVETGLLSPMATQTSVYHWLIRCNLPDRIIHIWRSHNGSELWNSPRLAQEAPYLSALIHMACCVQHFFATQDSQQGPHLRVSVSPESRKRFDDFCRLSLTPIVSSESMICGPKPRRRSTMPSSVRGHAFGVISRSCANSSTIGRRSGVGNSGGMAHLVCSPSAHRFGYVPPISSLRSRFDDVFVEGGGDEFGAVTSFSSYGDVGDLLG